ncbi:MAG: tRNA lysidine(34) synthetase TilS [Thermomicrobiales bacterium]|nr:tRNA lysidine(34) synthetase TilS [Thermomicrobiales bacterium]
MAGGSIPPVGTTQEHETMHAPEQFSGALPFAHFTGLEQRLLARLRSRAFAPDDLLVVGFSGGIDSLALAAALSRLARRQPVRLLLAHVDHRLRPESSAEQRRAADLAAALGTPFRPLRPAACPVETHPGQGVEEAARRERYRLLAGLVRSEGAAALVLAHQEEDQAESVLLHLLRGAGLTGARAMAEWGELGVPWWDDGGEPRPLPLWRPLLRERRATLAAFVTDLGLEPIQDPSNDDPAFRRNALRHAALPLLERISPGVVPALARYAAIAAEEDAVLAAWGERVRREATGDDGSLRAAPLLAAPPAVARRAVRSWLTRSGVTDLTAERTAAVLDLLRPVASGRTIELGHGLVAGARAGRVALRRSGAMGDGG